jgi:uncharacterized protein YjbI with pentapeptide repeats
MIKIKLARKTHPPYDKQCVEKLLRILERGSSEWNRWRSSHRGEYIDLRGISLFGRDTSFRGVNLSEANLSDSNLARVDFEEADLSACYATDADFQGANLRGANLQGAYLVECDFAFAYLTNADLRLTELSNSMFMSAECDGANFQKAKLHSTQVVWGSLARAILAQADFSDSILREADLSNADLTCAHLDGVSLVEANLQGANLDGCHVFGTSVWKSNLHECKQSNLVITPEDEPGITVDNLKVAQFIYMILNDNDIRDVIDTITSKVVLIIGRFTAERKAVLDAIRDELRRWNYTPVMFDFARPASKNFIETVNTLAGMSRFIIADLTDAKVVIQELHTIVRQFPSVPVKPLLLKGAEPTAVLLDFMDYPTFLTIHQYADETELLKSIDEKIIAPAEAKANEIQERRKKAEQMLRDLRSKV